MGKQHKQICEKKKKQEFQPVGGEPAVYLRVAGRIGEPETLTENILFQLKARAA